MGKDKTRVLHVLCSDRYSGAENVACQIIRMFSGNSEYEMAYCSPDGPIREALAERGVTFLHMKRAALGEVSRVIKEYRPSVIHAHDMRASLLTALTCGKIPYISHIHVNNSGSGKVNVRTVLYRAAAQKAKHIFWVSASSFQDYRFRKGLTGKSEVLYNTIDTEQLKERAAQAPCQDRYDIVFLGRLTEQKDPCRLVDVLEKAAARNGQLQAAIVGSGDMEQVVKERIAEKKLNGNIHCLGFVSNPSGILKKAKVMLMTSLREGTPMVALEAMALGTPIVSTPVDGMCDLVTPGETGYLSNDDEALAEYCVRLSEDETLRAAMSKAAAAKASQMMDLAAYRTRIDRAYTEAVREETEK